jgi:hypothetical protein
MTRSISSVRPRFEQALLLWLRCPVDTPRQDEKIQAWSGIYACLEQCLAVETNEPYWPHGLSLVESLRCGRLPDQLAARQVLAQLNLLLEIKNQRRHFVPKRLWQDTLALCTSCEPSPLVATDDFLQQAEENLSRLELKRPGEQTRQGFATLKNHAQAMVLLAEQANFFWLARLARSLDKLAQILLLVDMHPIRQAECHGVVSKVQRSMRSLLHQAAAGNMPRQDPALTDALFACEHAHAAYEHSRIQGNERENSAS